MLLFQRTPGPAINKFIFSFFFFQFSPSFESFLWLETLKNAPDRQLMDIKRGPSHGNVS